MCVYEYVLCVHYTSFAFRIDYRIDFESKLNEEKRHDNK